jgi:hypothetical protein
VSWRASSYGRTSSSESGFLMHIEKARIVAILRSRGMHERADWVDRALPALIDTDKNAGLLQTLDIDPAAMTTMDVVVPTA